MLFRRRSGVCDKVEKLTCRCCGKTNKMYIYIVGTNRGPKYKAVCSNKYCYASTSWVRSEDKLKELTNTENMRMRKHIYFIY